MESNITVISESEKEISFSYSPEEIKPEIETEVAKQAKKIQIDGFRKGKAPKHIVKRMYGDALEYDAAEKVANKLFWDNIKEMEINPIGEPSMVDMQFKPEEGLSFKVRFEVMPEFEVKDYSGFEIEVPALEVADEEIEQEIKRILFSNSTTEQADVVENENYNIVVDLTRISKEGEPVEGVNQQGVKIQLYNDNVNKEIVDNAKGKKVGEIFSFSFHDHTHHSHNDAETNHDDHTFIYEASLIGIEKVILPELDEELIKKASRSNLSTEAELRESIKKDIQSYYDNTIDEITDLQLEKKVIENNFFMPPATYINNYLEHLVKQEIETAKKDKKRVPDANVLREKLKAKAENSVRWLLLRDKIIEKESISLTDDRIKELAEQNAAKLSITIDILMNYYKSEDMRSQLLSREFYDFLRKNNTINRISPEEFNKKHKK